MMWNPHGDHAVGAPSPIAGWGRGGLPDTCPFLSRAEAVGNVGENYQGTGVLEPSTMAPSLPSSKSNCTDFRPFSISAVTRGPRGQPALSPCSEGLFCLQKPRDFTNLVLLIAKCAWGSAWASQGASSPGAAPHLLLLPESQCSESRSISSL